MEQIRTNCEREDVNIVLVGCKSDLETERKVTEEDARQTAKNYQIPFLEVSAKLGSNID